MEITPMQKWSGSGLIRPNPQQEEKEPLLDPINRRNDRIVLLIGLFSSQS
jgi:hypothetical protein